MVQRLRPDLDAVFHALSDPTRRAMVAALANGVASIGEIAEPHDMSFAAASKHVRVLERAGIVHRTVCGRRHICKLNVRPLAAADKWLRHYEAFWDHRLDALETLLRDARSQ